MHAPEHSKSCAIDFDHAATTRCLPEAFERLQTFTLDHYGNPSSHHALGERANKAVQEARQFFAKTLNTQPAHIIFTGSGTEADNLAITGHAQAQLLKNERRGRILVGAAEHPATLRPALALKAWGFEVQQVPTNNEGRYTIEALEPLLTADTLLVSLMQVNNITGALNPINELAEFAHNRVPGVFFHSDIIQGFGKAPAPSKADALSLSAHKIQGPKGIGALIWTRPNSKPDTELVPIIHGGEQEFGLRSGTQNAGLIAAFHAAAQHSLAASNEYNTHYAKLRHVLRTELKARGLLAPALTAGAAPSLKAPPLHWNSPEAPTQAVSHIISLSAAGFLSGPLARVLEEEGAIVSTGSACGSARNEPDPVLLAMGLHTHLAQAAVRISFGPENTEAQVAQLAQAIDKALGRMALLSGRKIIRSHA